MIAEPLQHREDYRSFCHQKLGNPYPLFDELRDTDPVHWCEPLGSWLSLRYTDAFVGLNDARLMGGRPGMYQRILTPENWQKAKALVDHLDLWMTNLNPPRHTRIRKLAGLAFTPRHIKTMVPRIKQIVQDRLNIVKKMGKCDFANDFCYWVPATVICDMLGLPQSDHDQFRLWMSGLVPFTSAAGPEINKAVDSANKALQELRAYFERQFEDRRANPRDDILSALVHAEIDGDRMSPDELFAVCIFLFDAGHETTASLLASGTMLLLTHAEQLELFRRDTASVLDTAIEEFARYESPVTRAIRWASEDMPVGMRMVKKGDMIVFLIGAINRDPAQFIQPEKLNIRRQPNKHLGFGWGRHFCIGAELARLEAGIAFSMIFEQLPKLRLADEAYRWRAIFGIRSLEKLPVRVN